MASKSYNTANNISNTYGFERFINLLASLERGTSDSVLAKEFNVSRQRIHQWKQALGVTKKTYYLDQEVIKYVNSKVNGKVTV